MSGVYSLLTKVEITFYLPKLYLKKSIKKLLNVSNSIFCSMWKTDQRFIIFFFFSLIISKSTLQKRSFLYYKNTLFFFKYTGKTGLKLNMLKIFPIWAWNYAWWYALISKLISWSYIALDMSTAMVSFKCSNLNIQLSLTWTLQWSL